MCWWRGRERIDAPGQGGAGRTCRDGALSQEELDQVWSAVVATTKDPPLDLLLVRFHLESSARRMGAINLRLKDLNQARQTVWLREKFDSQREQPVSAGVLQARSDLAAARGSTGPDDPVFVTSHQNRPSARFGRPDNATTALLGVAHHDAPLSWVHPLNPGLRTSATPAAAKLVVSSAHHRDGSCMELYLASATTRLNVSRSKGAIEAAAALRSHALNQVSIS